MAFAVPSTLAAATIIAASAGGAVEQIGSYLGYASIVGLGVLALLYFAGWLAIGFVAIAMGLFGFNEIMVNLGKLEALLQAKMQDMAGGLPIPPGGLVTPPLVAGDAELAGIGLSRRPRVRAGPERTPVDAVDERVAGLWRREHGDRGLGQH